jgi:hypothetical protein
MAGRSTGDDPFTPSDLDKFRNKARNAIIEHLTGVVDDGDLNELLDELDLERTSAKVGIVIEVQAETIMTPQAFGNWLADQINDLNNANGSDDKTPTFEDVKVKDFWEA